MSKYISVRMQAEEAVGYELNLYARNQYCTSLFSASQPDWEYLLGLAAGEKRVFDGKGILSLL